MKLTLKKVGDKCMTIYGLLFSIFAFFGYIAIAYGEITMKGSGRQNIVTAVNLISLPLLVVLFWVARRETKLSERMKLYFTLAAILTPILYSISYLLVAQEPMKVGNKSTYQADYFWGLAYMLPIYGQIAWYAYKNPSSKFRRIFAA